MDSLDKKIEEIYSTNIELPEWYKYTVRNTLREEKNKQKYKNISKLFVTAIATVLSITIVVYAGNEIYKKSIAQTSQKIESYSSFIDKMDVYEETYGIYYKKIDSKLMLDEYKNYIKELSVYNDEDLVENYLLMTYFSGNDRNGLKIADITFDNNLINIKLENENIDSESNFITTKVPKQYLNSNLKFEIIPGTSEIGKYGYTLMKEISEDYIVEQAKKEDCIIIDSMMLVSDNIEKLYSFEKETKKGKNLGIRIIKNGIFSGNTKFIVYDIVYYNNYYYVCIYNYNRDSSDGPETSFFKAGNIFGIDEIEDYGIAIYTKFEDIDGDWGGLVIRY